MTETMTTEEQYILPLMEATTLAVGQIMADEINLMFTKTFAATGCRAEVRDDFPGHDGPRVALIVPGPVIGTIREAMVQDIVVSFAIGVRVGLKLARSCEFCGSPDNRPNDVEDWACPYCGVVWNQRTFRGVDRSTRAGAERL